MSAVKDITGETFHRLTVLRRAENARRGLARWECRCDCGASVVANGSDLRNGHTRSCGCLQTETIAAIADAHNKTHGQANTPIYAIWRGMVKRCTDPSHRSYPAYGGRGIAVCAEWLSSFERFYQDFGCTRPDRQHTMDRRDNNAGYTPSNVRWVTGTVQQNNRRDNVRLTHAGKSLTVAQWAREIGISSTAISFRIKSGWPVSAAVTLPAQPNRRYL